MSAVSCSGSVRAISIFFGPTDGKYRLFHCAFIFQKLSSTPYAVIRSTTGKNVPSRTDGTAWLARYRRGGSLNYFLIKNKELRPTFRVLYSYTRTQYNIESDSRECVCANVSSAGRTREVTGSKHKNKNKWKKNHPLLWRPPGPWRLYTHTSRPRRRHGGRLVSARRPGHTRGECSARRSFRPRP